jgi:hypothetical protein
MQRLGHARPAGGGWRFADIENVRGKVQFVFNDGAGLWDSTPVGEEERTFYEADRAGAVCVKDGRLTVVGGGSPVLPPPSRTNRTRLVPPSLLTGHVSSLLP